MQLRQQQEAGGEMAMQGGGDQADTTYTKVFVGGLAWETQKETMKRHFEQYGEIVEAVVITDKLTGRSKGYGFVTFKEAEAASRACVDATPVIDGRRANCNLASLRAHHRSRPSSFHSNLHGNRFRMNYMVANPTMGGAHASGAIYMGSPMYPHPQHHQLQGPYTYQHGFPTYQIYGYPYSPELAYQQAVYSPQVGTPHYQQFYTGGGTLATASSSLYNPYNVQYSQPSTQQAGFSMQLPQVMQYGAASSITTITTLPHQYHGAVAAGAGGSLVPIPTTPVASSGVALASFSSAAANAGIGSVGIAPTTQMFTIQQHQSEAKSDQAPAGRVN